MNHSRPLCVPLEAHELSECNIYACTHDVGLFIVLDQSLRLCVYSLVPVMYFNWGSMLVLSETTLEIIRMIIRSPR